MIRLTVEQLHTLQERIQSTGEVNATILPLGALTSSRFVIAWAKGRSLGEELYLSVWQDARSWDRARMLDSAEGLPAYAAVLFKEAVYTHSYTLNGVEVGGENGGENGVEGGEVEEETEESLGVEKGVEEEAGEREEIDAQPTQTAAL